MEAPGTQDDAPAIHKSRPFLIALRHNGRTQNLMRPETLNKVRNNAVWAFSLPIDTPLDLVAVRYRDGPQTLTASSEEEWMELGSRRKLRTFSIEVVDKASSPVVDPTAEDSGFGALWAGASPAKIVKAEHNATNIAGGPSWNTQSTGDAWGAAASTAPTVDASNADPWGDTTATDAFGEQDAGTSTLDPWGSASNSSPSTFKTTVQDAPKDPWDEVKDGPALDEVKKEPVKPEATASINNLEDAKVSNDAWGSSESVVPAMVSGNEAARGDKPETKAGSTVTAFALDKPAESTNDNPWEEEIKLEDAPKASVNSAWGDADDDGTVPAGTQPAINDSWGASSTVENATSYSQNAHSDRGRGVGRGGGGRGGGSDRFSRDVGEERGSSTFQSRSEVGSTRGNSNNQMYQAQDSGWGSRTQRHHPYSRPNNQQQSSQIRYESGRTTASFDYSLPASQALQSTSYEAKATATYNHLSLLSNIAQDAFSLSSTAIPSRNQIDATQIPRQASIPAIFDMYGQEIDASQASRTTTAHDYASITSSAVLSSKSDKCPW